MSASPAPPGFLSEPTNQMLDLPKGYSIKHWPTWGHRGMLGGCRSAHHHNGRVAEVQSLGPGIGERDRATQGRSAGRL